MISNAQLTPVLPVADVTRATSFYRDRLGLKDAGDDPGGNHTWCRRGQGRPSR